MNLQIIKSIQGKAEYVLLPMNIYNTVRHQITEQIKNLENDEEQYVLFDPADYVENPIALARIHAGLTQTALAKRMKVTQAYISKLESQEKVSAKTLRKIRLALADDSVRYDFLPVSY